MPVREKGRRSAGSQPARPFSRPQPPADRRQSAGLFAYSGEPVPRACALKRRNSGSQLTPRWLYAHPMRPESKGQVHITAADPRRPPAINFNFLSSRPDGELTVRAVRIARAIMTAPAMAPFQVSEVAPGVDQTTDDQLLDWVKNAAETTYHPVGTCKMGSDPMGHPHRRPQVTAPSS
jgi:hypothetical protein